RALSAFAVRALAELLQRRCESDRSEPRLQQARRDGVEASVRRAPPPPYAAHGSGGYLVECIHPVSAPPYGTPKEQSSAWLSRGKLAASQNAERESIFA
ncbi:MAG TPA: hypothetical protein VKA25_05640, partial [Gemmatimonadales bacterium]|nr:hypothetical protein [Gemmatimonadales bacterium]